MNKKEIEELIKFVSKAGVSEVSLETSDIKITIKNGTTRVVEQVVTTAPIVHAMPQAAPVAAPRQNTLLRHPSQWSARRWAGAAAWGSSAPSAWASVPPAVHGSARPARARPEAAPRPAAPRDCGRSQARAAPPR